MDKQTAAGLLPCPFCGGKDIELGFDYAACRKCRAEIVGAWNGNESAAKEAWNIRAAAEPERCGKWCEYCKGRAYTKKPIIVITKYGRRIELTFEYCPKCGRKLRDGGGTENGAE